MNTDNGAVDDAAEDLILAVRQQFSDDEAETLIVLLESFEIYIERGKKYGQLWRSYGWKGNVFHILSKAARIKRMFWDNDHVEMTGGVLPHDMNDTMDDIRDIINYAAFVIRDMRDGNKYGG